MQLINTNEFRGDDENTVDSDQLRHFKNVSVRINKHNENVTNNFNSWNLLSWFFLNELKCIYTWKTIENIFQKKITVFTIDKVIYYFMYMILLYFKNNNEKLYYSTTMK